MRPIRIHECNIFEAGVGTCEARDQVGDPALPYVQPVSFVFRE